MPEPVGPPMDEPAELPESSSDELAGDEPDHAPAEQSSLEYVPEEEGDEIPIFVPFPAEATHDRTSRLVIPAEPEEPINLPSSKEEEQGVPVFPSVPSRPVRGKSAGRWTRPRLALIFAAGIGLGLAGALTLTEPLLEGLEDITLLPSPDAPSPSEESVAATSPASAPEDAAPENTGTSSANGAPPTLGEFAALSEDRVTAAPAEAPSLPPPGTSPAEQPEVSTLPPSPAASDLPAPGPAAELPEPAATEAPLLSLPVTLQRPATPGAVETARLPAAPGVLPAPVLPASPDAETVAGQTIEVRPGVFTAAPPPARPASLAPASEPEPSVDLAALTPETTAATDEALEDALADATGPERILIHVPSALSDAEAQNAITAIEGAGFQPSGRIDIQVPIGSTNIRYYFPEDADAARAMAAAITARTGQAAEARDFTGFRPRPAAGTVEVWLAGQPRSAPQRQQVASPPPAAAQPPRVQSQPPAPVATNRSLPQRSTPAEAAMRDLEILADEIARAISRSLND